MDDFTSLLKPSKRKHEASSASSSSAAGGASEKTAKVRRVDAEVAASARVEQLLAEADEFDVEELDEASLKRALLGLEKKVTTNQMLRAKHAGAPDRYLASEVELDDAIKALHILATAPELYPTVVRLHGGTTLLGLLTHENADIAIDAIELLHELCDPEAVGEDSAAALLLVDALIAGDMIELLIQNLLRFDESVEEEASGVHNAMGILESLLELRAKKVASIVVQTEGAVAWLLNRVRAKPTAALPTANKLYVAEILSILVQTGDRALRIELGRTRTAAGAKSIDGIDVLLQACAFWQRRNPVDAEEEECASNVFGVLAELLLEREHRERFRRLEGLELMVRMLTNNGYSFYPALRVLDYALAGCRLSCERAVDVGVLKHLFPTYMGRGARSRRKKFKVDHADVDKHAISLVATLCRELDGAVVASGGDKESGSGSSSASDKAATAAAQLRARVLHKFLEKELEKTDRTMELFLEYLERVEAVAPPIFPDVDDEDDGAFDEEGEMGLYLLRRVDAGLLSLTRAAEIAMYAGAAHSKIRERVHAKLRESRRGSDAIESVLREFLDSAPAADADAQAFFSPTQRARLAVLMKDVLSTMQ